MAVAKESRPGVFGRYEVIGDLGHGSMGVVYKARDPVIGRFIAIKAIPETFGLSPDKRDEFVQRLRQEAITAGRLQHPNIVTIYDVGESEIGPYIAMEYLEGFTLREVISSGRRLNLAQMAEVVSQVCEGLDYAHGKAVIHRDVKPANIMIVDGKVVKLMDLGIARIPMSELTKEGKLVGSPSYMSPEQLRGQPIDGRSDLFSLGVVVYQCMTLHKPYPGENINEICYSIVHSDFVPLDQYIDNVPDGLEYFMAKALAKNPDDRFQTGGEMAAAMTALVQDHQDIAVGVVDDTSRTSTVTGNKSGEDSDENPLAGLSNPNLTQVTAIDSIFMDLTSTARSFDLDKSHQTQSSAWLWLLIFLAVLAAAGGIWFFIRS